MLQMWLGDSYVEGESSSLRGRVRCQVVHNALNGCLTQGALMTCTMEGT
jgi:hypothetical protein